MEVNKDLLDLVGYLGAGYRLYSQKTGYPTGDVTFCLKKSGAPDRELTFRKNTVSQAFDEIDKVKAAEEMNNKAKGSETIK